MTQENSVFNTLNAINVNDKTEKKSGLTYLSWAWAWAEVKKAYPDASFLIDHYDGKPYLFDENLGYIISTKVTILGETLPMHLPVMDGANKAMKSYAYTYMVKDWNQSKQQGKNVFKDKTCEAATMFDINKTIMRCLVKNLAMFGLGLYIYAGEDLPEEEKPEPVTIEDALVEVKNVNTEEDRKTIWNKYPQFKNTPSFKDAIIAKANELKK